jgi:hypothetical protein
MGVQQTSGVTSVTSMTIGSGDRIFVLFSSLSPLSPLVTSNKYKSPIRRSAIITREFIETES